MGDVVYDRPPYRRNDWMRILFNVVSLYIYYIVGSLCIVDDF